MPNEITIYTDGAALGNPGPGGYGVVLIAGSLRKEISEWFRLTTNNRMELLAVIVGLSALRRDGCHVSVYSDSRYVVDAIEKGWLLQWELRAFRGKKNPDLWQRFLPLYRKHHVKFLWIPGHSSIRENECCDRLANAAARAPRFIDKYYENIT